MREIGAKGFVECSAKTRENLPLLFETALKIAVDYKEKEDAKAASSKKKKGK